MTDNQTTTTTAPAEPSIADMAKQARAIANRATEDLKALRTERDDLVTAAKKAAEKAKKDRDAISKKIKAGVEKVAQADRAARALERSLTTTTRTKKQ